MIKFLADEFFIDNTKSIDSVKITEKWINLDKKNAMTVAEMLIVIGIVGMIAQMVIPGIIYNTQEAQYKMGKDKVRMSIAEAGRILSVTEEISNASSAEDFVKNVLSKHLKITKFCAPADMEQCGMPSGNPTTFKQETGTVLNSMPTTWSTITFPYGVTTGTNYSDTNPTTQNYNNSYVFLSADGIAVNLFYNPYCVSNALQKTFTTTTYPFISIVPQLSLDTACMNGVYDMNGLRKPNQVGKDIGFFGVFYNGVQSTSVATLPYKENGFGNWSAAEAYCRNISGYKLPTIDELSSLYLGSRITGLTYDIWLWSASGIPGNSLNAQGVAFFGSGRTWNMRSDAASVRCVRE